MTETAPPLTLAAVVVTYNRFAQLRRTVERLLAEACDHLIIVDNGSSDGSRAWLAGLTDPRLRLLLPNQNLGGAGGFEQGMRYAVREFDPDWLLVMDDDARPDPGALAIFRGLDLNGWDGVAAAVRLPSGQICDMNRPSVNPFWNMRTFLGTLVRLGGRNAFHLTPEAYEKTTPYAVDISSFVGFFISRQGVAQAGYPDGRLFVYGEDGLYTIGLRKAGGRIGFFPQVRFEHDCSTFGGKGRQFQPIWKTYYYHRNLLLLYREAAGWLFWPMLLLVLPKWLLKGRHQGTQKRIFYRLLWRAVKDGLGGHRTRSLTAVAALATRRKR